MELNGTAIRMLKLVSTQGQPVHSGRMIGSFLGCNLYDIHKARKTILDTGFITEDSESLISITEIGKHFLKIYDLYGSEEIFRGDLRFAILKFLFELNDRITLEAFPQIFKDHAPQESSYPGEHNLMHYLEFNSDIKQYINTPFNHTYVLNYSGKTRYEFEIKEKKKELELKESPSIIQYNTYGSHNQIAGRDLTSEHIGDKIVGEIEETKGIHKKALWVHRQTLIWTIVITFLTLVSVLIFLKYKG